ncbi:uncharacterized protein DNG_07162 [Cephalotrichum gorgonifer]|uniref:Uncharacterized protein n=1 Tax=Cephalotrichum gorgonifer TaxID=2041049 RepID=A0AAE8N1Y8_9PEZI|nr:uncharacterized protein DNG_07162 [Cephalotrichum gorgonifer]
MSPQKAAHYLKALDEARCDGNWSAIPELVRKVRKHAPTRSCIALVAETECAISQATLGQATASNRPSTALTPSDLAISNPLQQLLDAIDNEDKFPEDRFQASVCAGWLHWAMTDYTAAISCLPSNLDETYAELEGAENVSDWTNVCALKAAYLKANCVARDDDRVQALYIFETGLPALTSVWASKSPKQQLRYWAELFLTEYCMLSSKALLRNDKSIRDANSLACFRAWARYWEIQTGPLAGGHGFRGSVPRRRVWAEYYIALSRLVEEDHPYPTAYLGPTPSEQSARTQLRMELKKVESAYESLLLNETQFPRADEEREEVEEFVRLVVKNWSIMCGRGWREFDLGQGGREATSRGVLEILYRAATKTFHSTAILRNLFTVHLAVAEFDLAFKAYDSYIEIVKKARARVEKTGNPEPGLDDDSAVLETMSQCILALCRYGDHDAIEKARDVAGELEDMLARLPQIQSAKASAAMPEINESSPEHPPIPHRVLAQAWQVIGLAHANWSRVMFDSALRIEVQNKAVRCLRKSLSPEFGRSRDIRGLFALGLLLAERRELTAAIDIVKAALAAGKTNDPRADLIHGRYWQERSLISLWHLLGLLLSARQDYGMAAKACEAAFEQFKDTTVLFGHQEQFRSHHLNEAEARRDRQGHQYGRGLVDEMDVFEKESMLEVKMTQLALIELVDGPDVAVNASSELLALYARLFGTIQTKALNPPKTADVPKTSGTLRSIKGSIFGRSGRGDTARGDTARGDTARGGTARQINVTPSESSLSSVPTRPQTTASVAPTIQITQENGRSRVSSRAGSMSRRNSLRKRDPSRSRRRAASSGPTTARTSFTDGESVFTPDGDHPASDVFASTNRRQASIASTFSRGRTLPHMDSYLSSRPEDVPELPFDSSTMPTPLPLVEFSKVEARRQRSTVLVGVWLTVAGFYRRAGMFEDCKGAVGEARKTVQGLEAEAREIAGGLTGGGTWGEKKTIEELWGDVWAELGYLAIAMEESYVARDHFESALTYFPNHPSAIVGLSNVLLDIYTGTLLPPPPIPQLDTSGPIPEFTLNPTPATAPETDSQYALPSTPLGLSSTPTKTPDQDGDEVDGSEEGDEEEASQPTKATDLAPAHKATSLPLVDRLAARDRAYGLLSGLTKLGTGWNYSEAWLAIARAHEESGEADRAAEALWWCVELEEGRGVRGWGSGAGYIVA